MAYEKKPNKGFLFVNRERKTDKHPTSKGYIVLIKEICEKMLKHNDFELQLSAWVDSEKGYNSLSVDDHAFNKRNESNTSTTPRTQFVESDSSIPL